MYFFSAIISGKTGLQRLAAGLFSAAFFMLAAGCSSGGGARNFVRPDYDISSIRKIAVLPFESLATNNEHAGESIRKVVTTELLIKGYEVVEPGEVARELTAMKVSFRSLTSEDFRKIGRNLGVDAVMTGSVESYRISPGLTVQYPDVAIGLRLIGAASGAIVWSVVHSSGGPSFMVRHFGTEGPSLGKTAHIVVREAIDALAGGGKGG